MKNTVHIGFILVILLMTTLSVIWLIQIKSSNETVLDLIKQYNIKIEHAHTMSNATRFRQANLLSMLVIKDEFELDDEVMTFYENAYPYRVARDALHSMPMSKEEEGLHDRIDHLTRITQPLSNNIVNMFEEKVSKEKIIKAINGVRETQVELFKNIDRFVALQKKYGEETLNYSRQQFDDEIIWAMFFGIISILIAMLISRYVTGYVVGKNTQLRTAGKEMELAYLKAEEATELKSEFLATMSHEIRTPLTAVIGFAETTLYSEQTMAQRLNAIQTIIRSSKHLLQIINDILDLSKVEANKLEIELSEVSVFDVLNEIKQLEEPSATEKKISFTINYLFPLPDKVKTDRLRIKQIILNLCNNAIKFTDSGNVVINVTYDDAESVLLFEVVDSGIGISKEQQEIIFQPYRQADSSTTRKFGGTGLGLSLSKLLAQRLGGSLTVSSKVGVGSQFKFHLPVEKLASTNIVFDEKSVSVHSQGPSINALLTRLSGNVLLAEDNTDNQDLFSIYLKRIGVDVTIVENGKLAIEATEKNDFDLILMDMRMPVMGGIEAVEILREQGFKKPIVAVTANAMREDKEKCFNAGCNDFLTKPIDSAALTQTLEKYLDAQVSENTETISMVSSLLENDSDMIKLVKRFVSGFSSTLEQIEELINKMDWQALSEILHKLKGTGGNFGFQKVSDLAAKMEFQVANKSQSELLLLLLELKESNKQMLLGLEEK